MGGVAKEYITKHGCEIYLRRAPLEMLLKISDSRNFSDQNNMPSAAAVYD
jgi:hypothetical protein